MNLGASYQYENVPQFQYAQPANMQAHFTSHPAVGGQQHAAAPHPDWYGSYLAETGDQDPYSAPHSLAPHFGYQVAAPDPDVAAALAKMEKHHKKELGQFKVRVPKWISHNPSDPTVGASASSSGAPAKSTSKVPGKKPTAPAPKPPAPKPASQKPSSTKKCKKCGKEYTDLGAHYKKHPTHK